MLVEANGIRARANIYIFAPYFSSILLSFLNVLACMACLVSCLMKDTKVSVSGRSGMDGAKKYLMLN